MRDVKDRITERVDLVKMLGICEYLTDEQIAPIAMSLADIMPDGASLVFNSLSDRHGTDRFFRRVFGLNMIHRSVDQLQDIFSPAGFGQYRVFSEPLGVYHVVVARMAGTGKGSQVA